MDATPRLARLIGSTAAAGVVALAAHYEGTVKHAYWDPVPILTACTGHTSPTLKVGDQFSDEECDGFLDEDLTKAAQGVQDCVTVMLSDGELIAYTDFTFNEGIDTFCKSSMARLVNAGDHEAACKFLPNYNVARIGGKFIVLKGLTRRRVDEQRICLGGLQ